MASASGPVDSAAPSQGYRRYVLCLLLVVYALSFLDRQIVNILAEPIKRDLHLADWQMGAMTGLAFALLYTTLGVPLARLSDRGNRSWIISGSLLVWSGFTVLCGLSTSFIHLLLARVGVGVGEAGCSPPAQSLIAEMTPREQRGKALGFYSMGVPIGSLLGMLAGGLLAQHYGWRIAFLTVGAPGVLLAVISFFTLKDPRQKRPAPAKGDIPTLAETARELVTKKSFWWLAIGTALTSFVGYAHQSFLGSFFLRNHADGLADLVALTGAQGSLAFLGIVLGLILGIFGAVGTWFGGVWADRLGSKDARGYTLVPAIGTLIACPLYAVAFMHPSAAVALVVLIIPTIFKNLWFGPVFAAVQGLVHTRSRSMATAILLLILNAGGLGLGPLCLGLLSDALATSLGEAAGLRWAMISINIVGIGSALAFWQARRTIVAEMQT